MLEAKLIVVGGDAKAKEFDLRLPTVIGRSHEATLTLPHPLVSRRHTELFEKDGQLYVKDLGSLNGTYVNNRRISSAQRLKPNELLTLGNVTFRAMYDAKIDHQDAADDLASQTNSANSETSPADEKDETVSYLHRRDEAHPVRKPHSQRPLKSVAMTSKPAPKKDTAPEFETPSDILGDALDFAAPKNSASASALESLPALPPKVDLAEEALDFGAPAPPAIESIDLDTGGPPHGAEVSDASLGSFLKKLPR